MAKARMRRDPSLLGQGLANWGLFVSYFFLICTMLFVSYKVYGRSLQKTLILKDADVLAAMASRGVDRVEIGDPTSEAEHGLQFTHNEAGTFFGRQWRAVSAGGQFSYVMKVLPNQAMNLDCRYWGSDTGGRVFDILVEQRVIATQTLDRNVPEQFFDVEYKIPQRITRGKTQVTVEFRAHPGLAAGGVFNCQILKR
jgi:hypothetical protein